MKGDTTMNGVHNPFDDIQNAAFMRLRENRHKREAQQAKEQEAFEARQNLINDSVSDFNSGTKKETSSFEDQVTDPTKEATKDVGKEATTPADILENTHKDADFNQDEAIKEAEEAVSSPEKSRNELIQDNMNEKLNDQGITVDNVNSTGKIERGTTKGVTMENRPVDYDYWNNKVQDNMNSKLADDGIKVKDMNIKSVEGKESVNPVKNVNPPKTETKRFKDDSGFVTRTIPNKPVGHITQGTGSQKSQSQSHDSRDDKDRPADLL